MVRRRRSTRCCYRFDEEEVALHHRLRPGRSRRCRRGVRGRRADERPADRHADRLPQEHPDRARGLRRRRGRPQLCDSGHLPAEDQADIDEPARQAVEDGEYASDGEALFNLELASGAYSCARCHTQGWSYGEPDVPGQGALGWNLTDGAVDRQFPNERRHDRLRQDGSELGAKYGTAGSGQRADARLRPACSPTSRSRPSSTTCGACDGRCACWRITWEPELRGILIVIIAVGTLCGSVYLSSAPTSAPGSASSSRSPGSPAGWR